MNTKNLRPEENTNSVVIIHNGDQARLQTTVESLSIFLGPPWTKSSSIILEKQPAFAALERKFAFQRCLYSLCIALRKQGRLKKPILGYLQVIFEHFIQIIQMVGPSWSGLQRRVYAEIALTEKHIAALENISISGLPGLVVEDDIQLADDFDASLKDLLEISNLSNGQLTYISLCVAFTLEELGIQNTVQDIAPKFHLLAEGVANTTAAYWLSLIHI